MARTRGFGIVAIGIAALTHVAGVPMAHAGVIQQRFAAPTGGPTSSCAQDDPCDLVTAINAAVAGADIVVEPGVYYGGAPLTTELTSPYPLTVHAATPNQIPVINTAASTGLSLTSSGVSEIAFLTSGSTAGIQLNGGSADHVAVFASSGAQGACAGFDVTLSDSVCAQTGANDPAIGIVSDRSGSITNSIRNVTAVSSGAGGYAFAAAANNNSVSTSVSNTILDGAGGDIVLATTGTASTTMTIDHSAYRPAATTPGGGQVVPGSGNVSAPPQFVDPAQNNFAELPSSPTVDAGRKAPVADVDLANLPRTIGKAPDIGAYELPVAPTIQQLRLLEVTRHSVAITVKVNGQGLPSTRQVSATAAGGRPATNAAAVTSGKPTKIVLHRLSRHRRYLVTVTATSLGGTTTTDREILTK